MTCGNTRKEAPAKVAWGRSVACALTTSVDSPVLTVFPQMLAPSGSLRATGRSHGPPGVMLATWYRMASHGVSSVSRSAVMTLRRWRRVASSAAAGCRPVMAEIMARCSGSEACGRPGRSDSWN